MDKQGILLSDAPKHFFDPKKWRDLCGMCSTLNIAVELLKSRPSFSYLTAPRGQQPYELGKEISADFRQLLTSGNIVASGITPPSTQKQVIPKELWAFLEPDFMRSEATSPDYKFISVRLDETQSYRAQILKRRYLQLLKSRLSENGEELKKVLEGVAEEELGPLAVRPFNAAYAEVYGRKRGRPHKPPKSKK